MRLLLTVGFDATNISRLGLAQTRHQGRQLSFVFRPDRTSVNVAFRGVTPTLALAIGCRITSRRTNDGVGAFFGAFMQIGR